MLNSFLQFIEKDDSDSIIIAATNNLKLLDQALFRRFDDVLHYELPSESEIIKLIENRLGQYNGNYDLMDIVKTVGQLSHSEISQACNDAVKEAILTDKKFVEKEMLIKMIKERTSVYRR